MYLKKEGIFMSNFCNFQVEIIGKKENLEKVLSYFNPAVVGGKCTGEHFFPRVKLDHYQFGILDDSVIIYGECANSVCACFLDGKWSYSDLYKKDCPNVTDMESVSRELNLRVSMRGIEENQHIESI